MRFEQLKQDAEIYDINLALDKLKTNLNMGYTWIGFRNKAGIMLEIGGRFYKDCFEFKVYIPSFFNGEYIVFSNGFIKSDFSFDSYGIKTYPSKNMTHKMNIDELIHFIDNTNFKKWVDTDPNLHTEICSCCQREI